MPDSKEAGHEMVEFVKSKILGRRVRKAPWDDAGVSLTTEIKAAIKEDRMEEALKLLELMINPWEDIKPVNMEFPFRVLWWWTNPAYIAAKSGEAQIEKALRATIPSWLRSFYDKVVKMSIEERVQLAAEIKRAERPNNTPGMFPGISIVEDPEKYQLIMDPCGYAGLHRRKGKKKEFPNAQLFGELGSCQKAYPWTWGIEGVNYRCLLCCMMNEILPIEWGGYPLWITDYHVDPNEPCRWLIYKNQELIPEKYFTRVGKKKPG